MSLRTGCHEQDGGNWSAWTRQMRFPWKYVAVATVSYTCIYFFCRKWVGPDQSDEFNNRIVTLAHGISSVSLSAYCCFKLGPYPFSTIDIPLSTIQTAVLSNSLGYFIFDIVWCLRHENEGALMLIHHIVSVASLTHVLRRGVNGSEYLLGLGLLEMTNPFLQTRWFLRTFGYHNRTPYYVVECLFIVQFILVRVVLGTCLIPRVLKLRGSLRDFMYFYVAMYAISGLFYLGMVQYMWRKYVNPRNRYDDSSTAGEGRGSIGQIE